MTFLHKALLWPTVHIDRSCLFIDGLKIGNLVLVLHALFGNKNHRGVHNRKTLAAFATRMGFSSSAAHLHSSSSSRTTVTAKKKPHKKTAATTTMKKKKSPTTTKKKKKRHEDDSHPTMNPDVYNMLK